MGINSLEAAGVATALSLSILASAPAQALPAPTSAGSVLTVKWTAVGVIGVASVLVGYDLVRRFTCTGDVFNLGGPGFTSPARNMAVMPPRRCAPAR